MFPITYRFVSTEDAFLCLRRGVSDLDDFVRQLVVFSLPTQRCFRLRRSTLICFSLPTQRCFSQKTSREEAEKLFSAYAEVFPARDSVFPEGSAFLCLRRGVSHRQPGVRTSEDFSLPTQRCFQAEEMEKAAPELFSAYAEVFLSRDYCAYGGSAFLCLRRGVSVS